MIIYKCLDLRKVGLEPDKGTISNFFVYDKENNGMVTTAQIRRNCMMIGDEHASKYIKDFGEFRYAGNLKNQTNLYHYKGYVDLNNENAGNIKYFEPFVDLKYYTEIPRERTILYPSTKNVELCNDEYRTGRFIALKEEVENGESLIGFLYGLTNNFYHDRNSIYNYAVLDALIAGDLDNKFLNRFNTTELFNNKELMEKIVHVAKGFKNCSELIDEYHKEVNKHLDIVSKEAYDLWGENVYRKQI